MNQAMPMPSKPATPRLWFTDFWHEASAQAIRTQNHIYNMLSHFYDIQLDADNPEFLIHSIFGGDRYRYRCVRIAVIGENRTPDFQSSDWAFSADPTQGRNFHLPLWAWNTQSRHLIDLHDKTRIQRALAQKNKFCAFLYSNPHAPRRKKFFKCLHARRPVDALGEVFHNIETPPMERYTPNWFEESVIAYQPYKFVIAFENQSAPGYTTEKILAAFLAHAVPIYWGDPHIARTFNPDAFINAHDFDTQDALAEYVLRVNDDEALYRRYLQAPKLRGNRLPEDADWQGIRQRFAHIFDTPIAPAWRTAPAFERWIVPYLSSGHRQKYVQYRKMRYDIRQNPALRKRMHIR